MASQDAGNLIGLEATGKAEPVGAQVASEPTVLRRFDKGETADQSRSDQCNKEKVIDAADAFRCRRRLPLGW